MWIDQEADFATPAHDLSQRHLSVTPTEILDFWFAPAGSERWFRSTPEFDALIERRLRSIIEAAAAGVLDHWATSPDGAVALCVLLDQFPRNAWRGTPRAFAYDAAARKVAGAAIAAGHDVGLPPERRLFLYLPLEHSEDLDARSAASVACPLEVVHPTCWLRPSRRTVRCHAGRSTA